MKKTHSLRSIIREKHYKAVIKRIPNINGIEDLLGQDRNGKVSEPSPWFYILPYTLGKVLNNDPNKVLNKRGIVFRNKVMHHLLMKLAPMDLHGKKLVIEDKAALPTGRPIIFSSNHYFLEDATSSVLLSESPMYLVSGSIPQILNSTYGPSACMAGLILINRKNAESRRSMVDKAIHALNLGTHILICPEGTWNRTPNKLLLDY